MFYKSEKTILISHTEEPLIIGYGVFNKYMTKQDWMNEFKIIITCF